MTIKNKHIIENFVAEEEEEEEYTLTDFYDEYLKPYVMYGAYTLGAILLLTLLYYIIRFSSNSSYYDSSKFKLYEFPIPPPPPPPPIDFVFKGK